MAPGHNQAFRPESIPPNKLDLCGLQPALYSEASRQIGMKLWPDVKQNPPADYFYLQIKGLE